MKRRILFVDDEEKILQGFKRLLHSYSNEWEMLFVEGGNEALKVLSSTKIDIIISDMRMPEMDGAQLLSIVQKKYPNVIRIILSGYSDKDTVIRTPKIAHRFIAKPCNTAVLVSTIEEILKLKKRFINIEMLNIVTGLDNVPSLPEFYNGLMDEMNMSNISIKKVGEILTQDIAMTAKVLQLVNSAFFGLPQKISNPFQAINLLGIEVIKSLVLFEKIFSCFGVTDPYKIFYDEIYNHSVRVGNLAKQIAFDESQSKKISDEALFGGLLHDIGKLICLKLTDYPIDIRKNMKIKGASYIESELELYETTHCELGSYLLNLWGLPNIITNIAEFHHEPGKTESNDFSALTAVYLANSVINHIELDDLYLERIGIEKNKYINIF